VNTLSAEEIELRTMVREACELFAPTAEDKGVGLHCDLQEESRILGDIRLIQRLLSNLLDNAIKYTPAGGSVTVAWKNKTTDR